jgi:hypothetical protein
LLRGAVLSPVLSLWILAFHTRRSRNFAAKLSNPEASSKLLTFPDTVHMKHCGYLDIEIQEEDHHPPHNLSSPIGITG